MISRLRIRTEDAITLRQIETLGSELSQLHQPRRPSQLQGLLEPYDNAALLVGWLACADDTARAQLAQYQRELRGVQPIIDGHYLQREFNLRPSPLFRDVLDHLRAARLDGQVITLADEHALVERWLQDRGLRELKSGDQEAGKGKYSFPSS